MLFVVTALAVWRLSSLLVNEAGPADVFIKLRNLCGVKYDEYSHPYADSILGGILSCVWCCSIWISFVASLFLKPSNFAYYIIYVLSLSATAIFIDTVINRINRDGQ